MREIRCAHCNAPLREGASGCVYCGAGTQTAAAAARSAQTRSTLKRVLKALLASTLLLCCAPFSLYGALYETVFAVRMEAPKYSAHPPPPAQRRAEALEPTQVFVDMRDTDGRSLAERKQEWRSKYEGRWVSWTGRVKEVHVYGNQANELRLLPVEGSAQEVEVFLDPLLGRQLSAVQPDQRVRVSGKLWGYYFLPDTIRLSDGAILEEAPSAPPP